MATEDPLDILVNQFGRDVVESAIRNLSATRTIRGKKVRRVASGALKNSLTYKIKKRYGNFIMDFTTDSAATRKYADVIHDGRRPGSIPAPIAEIRKWVKIKGIRPRAKNGGFIKATPKALEAMARAISISIGKKGIVGVPFYREALEAQLEDYGPKFIEALGKMLEVRLLLNSR